MYSIILYQPFLQEIFLYRSCRKSWSGCKSGLSLKKSRRKCLRSIRKNSGKKSGIFKSDCRNLPHNCRASAIKPTFLWKIFNSKSYNKTKNNLGKYRGCRAITANSQAKGTCANVAQMLGNHWVILKVSRSLS